MQKEQLFEFYIRNNWFKISRYYNQIAAKNNVSFSWGFILLNVPKEGLPSTSLGPKMGMEATSLSRTLKNLEEADLIVRKADKDDKRIVMVFLTDKGIEKRREARDIVLNFNEKIHKKLPPSKIKAFFEIMSEMDKILNELLEEKKEL